MNKELYVSTTPHETKVALVEDDQLAEIQFERENEYTLAGSIYKGRVTRVLPGMQSAFVDIGLERDAFLYVSDFLELQDEDEDGEFADVKVTGSTLASANGLIIAEPQLLPEEEDPEEADEEPVAEGDAAPSDGKDAAGAPRWRGRRRRRGRRGGRERVNGDRPADAQPTTAENSADVEAQPPTQGQVEELEDEPQPQAAAQRGSFSRDPNSREPGSREPRKRELRGFEPRGLVVHGLARNADADEVAPEFEPEAEADAPAAEGKSAAPAASFTPMLLPGESISKYNRGEGEAPAAAPAAESGSSEDSDRGYSRGRDRGDRDRGGRGRPGSRDRDRGRGGRDRGDRDSHEPREPREYESTPLPQNYTPIVLPGESISKYRGVEPTALPTVPHVEDVVSSAVEPADEPIFATETAAHHEEAALDVAAPVEQVPAATEPVAPAAPEASPDEPLASASYSGVSALPSLTQRHVAEDVGEDEDEFQEDELPAEVVSEDAPAVEHSHQATEQAQQDHEHVAPEAEPVSHHAPEQHHVDTPAEAEPVHAAFTSDQTAVPDAHVEADAAPAESEQQAHERTETKPEGRPGRRSWRDRVNKIFHPAPEPVAETHSVDTPSPIEAEVPIASATPAPENQYGSFVIEGGNVEHEELDEEEAEMPALAEHFDRYEEGEDDDVEEANGSQIGSAVRESGEESELEDEEYDFGAEEFEESELLAADAEEDEGEEPVEGEEPEIAAAAPEAGRERPASRFDRSRDRRPRRGVPPQRGGGRMRPRQQSRALPLISELLKEGQEILVQIAKEPIGKKGARITSHIALPGRFLVYMPTVNHIGVSRKISSEEERQRLKRIVSSERENGHGGFIVRTAASNIKEDELRADIRFLKHLWTEIRTRAESSKSPSLIYHDLNLVERILRDQVTSDFSQIWVDNESEYERVVRFASRFQPSLVRRIKLYSKDTPLYEQFGINEEINKSLKSKVWLKSGGYIVINQTEALVAIDINTGKYVGKTARLEDTIVKTNCDAVKEIVRQIRLRDLGGIIVVDFIDMDERKNRQKVMQALEEAMKSDRAPSKILQFNDFGLVAITRKRVKQSLERTLGTPCPYCDATGFVKSVQTVCNEIYVEMRKVRRHVESKEVILRVNPEVAKELKGGNGKWLQEMEELIGHPVLVKSDAQLHQEQFDMNY